MAQTARKRGKEERGSVCWNSLVPGYSICGRPGYWRIFDDTVPVGQKAGGFVKNVDVKRLLDSLYRHEAPFATVRDCLIAQLATSDFHKDIVR